MADTDTTPPAAGDIAIKSRPEKPDEAKYKADLAKAEKEHKLKMEQFVRPLKTACVLHFRGADSSLIDCS